MDQVQEVILNVEDAVSLNEIKKLKKLKGDGPYWRIVIGNYRIGLKLTKDDMFVFVRFLHRREI